MHPCVDCEPRVQGWWRCRLHQRIHDRQRGTRTQRGYTNDWLRLSKALVAVHVARYGHVCPGYNRPPHRSTDLTLDHRVPLARGGTVANGVDVLCRSCNGAKAAEGYLPGGAPVRSPARGAGDETPRLPQSASLSKMKSPKQAQIAPNRGVA